MKQWQQADKGRLASKGIAWTYRLSEEGRTISEDDRRSESIRAVSRSHCAPSRSKVSPFSLCQQTSITLKRAPKDETAEQPQLKLSMDARDKPCELGDDFRPDFSGVTRSVRGWDNHSFAGRPKLEMALPSRDHFSPAVDPAAVLAQSQPTLVPTRTTSALTRYEMRRAPQRPRYADCAGNRADGCVHASSMAPKRLRVLPDFVCLANRCECFEARHAKIQENSPQRLTGRAPSCQNGGRCSLEIAQDTVPA